MKKRAVSIVVTRFEGPVAECDKPLEVKGERVWERATGILRRIGNSGPKDMLGCFKCGFEITFEDGEQYEGRYDAKPGSESLSEHVRFHCEFYTGRAKAPWMGEKRYRRFLADVVKPEAKAAYEKFLTGYALGDDDTSEPEAPASSQEAWLESMGV